MKIPRFPLLGLAALFLWGFAPVASTPDIDVGASATIDVQLPTTAHWIYLQNNCVEDLYFRFTNRNVVGSETALGLGDGYPLRLSSTDIAFSAPVIATTVGASNSGDTACTFTLVMGR